MKRLITAFLITIISAPGFDAVALDKCNNFVCRDAYGNIPEDGVLPFAALCNVHVYNIGKTFNDAGFREEMNNVVAMKSELTTRALKRQYDFMDATIKRINMQLGKALLVAKNEAAGAPSAANASRTTTSSTQFNDCMGESSRSLVANCLRKNLAKFNEFVTGKKPLDHAAQLQLTRDIALINGYVTSQIGTTEKSATVTTADPCAPSNIADRDKVSNCLALVSGKIVTLEEGGQQSRNPYNPYAAPDR